MRETPREEEYEIERRPEIAMIDVFPRYNLESCFLELYSNGIDIKAFVDVYIV